MFGLKYGNAFRKGVSALLIVAMIATTALCVLPPLEAAAAGPGNIFEEMGFDIESNPKDYDENSPNPYGRDSVTMSPVYELFVGSDNPADSSDNTKGRTYGLYGHNQDPNNQWTLTPTAPTNYTNKYDAYLAVAGDFTGSGKKDIIVALGANSIHTSNSNYTNRTDAGLDMFFIEPNTGRQSTDVFKLYSGHIGKVLDDGYLNIKTKNLGGLIGLDEGEDSGHFFNRVLLQNYMQIVTGDFTGDGIDEIAVYIPEDTNPRIEVYQLQSTGSSQNAWETKSNWKLIYTQSVRVVLSASGQADYGVSSVAPNRMSMVVGDMNYDGIDDLAYAYGIGIISNTGEMESTRRSGTAYADDLGAAASHGTVQALLSTGGADTFSLPKLVYSAAGTPVTSGTPDSGHFSVSLAFGDLTGGNRDKLIIAELYEADENDSGGNWYMKSKVHIQAFDYDFEGNKFNALNLGMNTTAIDITRDDVHPVVRSDAVTVSPGLGMADLLYYRGFLYYMDENEINRSAQSLYMNHRSELRNKSDDGANFIAFFEYGIVAADLDNDHVEEIILSYNPVGTNDDGPKVMPTAGLVLSYAGITGSNVDGLSVTRKFTSEAASPDRFSRSVILMAAVDTDTDTMLMKYKEHYLTYTDPKVLAIMAGAPVYKALEHLPLGDDYVNRSGTSWTSIDGGGSSSSIGGQFNIGAYCSCEYDFKVFGVTLFSLELEVAYEHKVTWETVTKSTITHSVQYGAVGYEDAVALYTVPMSVYVYEVTYPQAITGGSDTQLVYVNVPYAPSVTVMPVDEYEKIAMNYSELLPKIRGEILTHTQGDPSTYPTSTAGLKDVRVCKEDYAMVNYGNGSQSQSIKIETEKTKSTSHNDDFSFKVGAGSGGFRAGITVGGGAGYGGAEITITGSEFAGEVFNMPVSARDYGYTYSWKVMQYYHYTDAKNKIPVVSYIVQASNAIQPVIVPINLDVDVANSTANSLTLAWDYPTGAGISRFQVYCLNVITSEYEPLSGGYVRYQGSNGSYSYVDSGLAAGTQYSYRVEALRSAAPTSSVLSPTVSGWTRADDSITLTLSQDYLLAYTDKSYTITSTLKTLPGASAATYMWEKYTSGEWKSIGFNTPTLTLKSPMPASAGEYRLRATQQIGQMASIVFSPTLTIEVTKRAPNLSVDISENGSNLVLSATLTNTATIIESGSIPSGTITFTVVHQGKLLGEFTEPVVVSTSAKTGTASIILPNAENGSYDISTLYSGDFLFQNVLDGPQYYLKGGSTTVYAEAPDQIYYGETFSPVFWRVSEENGVVTKTPLADAGYSAELVSVQKLQIFNYGTSYSSSFVPAVAGDDYIATGTDIKAIRLEYYNYYLAIPFQIRPFTHTNSYNYTATYSITAPDEALSRIDVNYLVNRRPVLVTAIGGEIEQSNISADR